jgi:hypothetical protein
MQADRIVEALRRYAFQPGEDVEKQYAEQDHLTLFTTERFAYEGERADWSIRDEAWVEDAVRVLRDSSMENFVATYGLLFGRDGTVLFLNDVATMRELGRRLGAGLDPVAYAQVLGELYSGQRIDGPVVHPFAATYGFRSGWLIGDVEAFLREYAFVDPSVVSALQVGRVDGVTRIEFCSHNYYLLEFGAAIDIYRWVVTAPVGQPASWSREPVAERLMLP